MDGSYGEAIKSGCELTQLLDETECLLVIIE